MSEDLLAASLLDEQKQTILEDRVRGAIWGQLVGDAFCLGTRWIYDLDELRRAYPGGVRGKSGASFAPRRMPCSKTC